MEARSLDNNNGNDIEKGIMVRRCAGAGEGIFRRVSTGKSKVMKALTNSCLIIGNR